MSWEYEVHNRYIGHGGLFYAHLWNRGSGHHEHVIVDAGSMPGPAFPTAAHNSLDFVKTSILAHREPASVLILITHLDIDHYRFANDLYNDLDHAAPGIIDRMVVTLYPNIRQRATRSGASLFGKYLDPLMEMRQQEGLRNFLARDPQRIRFITDPVDGYLELWRSDDGEARVGILSSRLCPHLTNDTNGNSSVFMVGCTTAGSTVFTGDVTGDTLNALLDNDALCDSYRQQASTYPNACITLPHHGSSDSLIRGGFLSGGSAERNAPLTVSKLDDFFDLLIPNGACFKATFASVDRMDEFGHPDEYVLNRFLGRTVVAAPRRPLSEAYLRRSAYNVLGDILDPVHHPSINDPDASIRNRYGFFPKTVDTDKNYLVTVQLSFNARE